MKHTQKKIVLQAEESIEVYAPKNLRNCSLGFDFILFGFDLQSASRRALIDNNAVRHDLHQLR
jgi:hypothetical protein